MTTYAFQQPRLQLFSFQPTLDGSPAYVDVPWSLFGQRYYIRVFDASGNLVLTVPRISSGAVDINLIAPWFQTSTLTWRDSTGLFEVLP